MKPLLTCREAAAVLRLHPHQIYRLAAERRIPHFRISGVGVRFDESDLERWLAEGRREIETRPRAKERIKKRTLASSLISNEGETNATSS
jgi:excisionase family DNA binding protein